VCVGGTVALDGDKLMGSNDPYEQTRFILKKIETALKEAGAKLEHVTRTRMYVTDIAQHGDAVGRAHGEVFANIRPATSMVQVVALIRPEFLVEIEADAIIV